MAVRIDEDPVGYRRSIGYMPEEAHLYSYMTVRVHDLLVYDCRDRARRHATRNHHGDIRWMPSCDRLPCGSGEFVTHHALEAFAYEQEPDDVVVTIDLSNARSRAIAGRAPAVSCATRQVRIVFQAPKL